MMAAEYIKETVGADVLNVAEYWVDLKWNGSDLEINQDAVRVDANCLIC